MAEDSNQQGTRRVSTTLTSTRDSVLSESLLLKTSESTRKRAAYTAILCVFCDAINLQCCAPNYPLMISPGHPQSFPSTGPFDIGSAPYVLSGATQIAMVISNIVFGVLSSRIGSRVSFLTLMLGSAIFTLAKYFAQSSFWAFTALNFVNGLFGASVGVANGYMTLLYQGDREKADTFIGYVMAVMVLGRGLGGLFTVLFPENLFMPLIPAATINIFASLMAHKYLLDPSDANMAGEETKKSGDTSPESINIRTLINVTFGAIVDNVGSLATVPLALSPVMYETYYLTFVDSGLEPVMSENQYRWLYSMIAVIVIPPALATPIIFKKIGVALTCVIANIMTAAVIVSLLLVAKVEPATNGTFALYVVILYLGFPLTIISNLSTGPMLDRVTPLKKKAMIQGLNVAIFDTVGSIFPIVFGLISDSKGNSYFMWICFWVSVFAALVNLPLTFDASLGKKEEEEEAVSEVTLDEDEVESLLSSYKYVPIEQQLKVNQARANRGEPFLRSRFGEYSPESIVEFEKLSARDLMCVRDFIEQRLAALGDSPEKKEAYIQTLNATQLGDESMAEYKRELGEWVSEYLHSNGYFVGLENAQLFKGFFMKCFPTMADGSESTVDNVEDMLVNWARLVNTYIDGFEEVERRKRYVSVGKLKKS